MFSPEYWHPITVRGSQIVVSGNGLSPKYFPSRQDALGKRPHPQFLGDGQRLVL